VYIQPGGGMKVVKWSAGNLVVDVILNREKT
jgi:hypothetical protein